MIAPGWYHAEGDPVGSQRYWDGSQWQGDAVMPTSPQNEVVYYAPADTQVDLGDVATRVALSETDPTQLYTQSPYSISTASVNVTRRKPLPEGLKNLTILVCLLNAIPLVFLAIATFAVVTRSALTGTSGGRFAPPGLNVNDDFAVAAFVMIAFLAISAVLIVAQARAALKDQAANLLAIGLVLLVFDTLNTSTQWIRYGQGLSVAPTFLATLTLVLQVLVTVWAGVLSSRS